MIVTVDGLTIEGGESARSYLQSLEKGSVEPTTTSLFRRAVQPGMVVVDVGAFLGQYSLLAARQVGDAGKVFAFEPDPRNFPFLLKNVQRNGFADRIRTVPQAVSDRAGEVSFYLDPQVGSGSSLVFQRRRDAVTEIVRTVSLDEFLGDSITPDLIKLDIEGGEIRALEGMAETVRRAGTRLTMFVECFPKALRRSGGARRLVEWLEDMGFQIYVIDEGGKRLLPITASRSSLWKFQLYLGLHSLLVVNFLCVRSRDHLLLAHSP